MTLKKQHPGPLSLSTDSVKSRTASSANNQPAVHAQHRVNTKLIKACALTGRLASRKEEIKAAEQVQRGDDGHKTGSRCNEWVRSQPAYTARQISNNTGVSVNWGDQTYHRPWRMKTGNDRCKKPRRNYVTAGNSVKYLPFPLKEKKKSNAP